VNTPGVKAKYGTLVVGAGVAGLAAARTLAEAGEHVAIVEARERLGGRILTEHVPIENVARPFPIELGAEFVHGLPYASWNLIGEAGLAAYELDGPQLCFDAGILKPCADEERHANEVLEKMMQWLAQQPAGTDPTFAEYLDLAEIHGLAREESAAYVEGFNAADHHLIGVAALCRQQRAEDEIQGDRMFHVMEGYDAVPRFLGERFLQAGGTVHLGQRVRGIRWTRGAVTLRCENGAGDAVELHADRAVITLPLGVLQASSVAFDPQPRRILSQAQRMAMGSVRRATLVFKSRFWTEFSFLFASEALLPTWWTPMPEAAPVITAWVGGPKAAPVEEKLRMAANPNALRDYCLHELAGIFGTHVQELEDNLASWHTHDWGRDEHALGAYSYAPAGAIDASEKMTQPVEKTLYFAGEHTNTQGHWGTVHGAIDSGMRAAAQILEERA
jgi:monoamine oxidase